MNAYKSQVCLKWLRYAVIDCVAIHGVGSICLSQALFCNERVTKARDKMNESHNRMPRDRATRIAIDILEV